ncbi:MAG: ATP-binding protein [Bacteroidetes bacterium]|nr:MAG: ATP-binding protein [Bacteroidota bacterium]TAG90702.1 MAG: ATP-binding protein [Bacteroidota bacterium]
MIYQFIAEKTNADLDFDITLTPDKQVYCFIGENGCGKTQLLENLAKSLIFSSTIFGNVTIKNYKYITFFRQGDIYQKIGDFSLLLPKKISINQTKVKNTAWDTIFLKDINNIGIEDNEYVFDFPIVFITAKSRGYIQNIDKNKVELLGSYEDRFLSAFTKTYKSIKNEIVEDNNLANWLNSRLLINPAFVKDNDDRIFEVEAFLDLLEMLEPRFKNELKQGAERLKNFSFAEGKLYFNQIPLDNLSTGFVSIFKIFQEIISGYGGWIGMLGEKDIRNTQGVVLIDEIESHLHAKWQYKIIPLLKSFFPKTTFYIATHSPLIVSATQEDEAYELVKTDNKVVSKKLGNPRNWYLADVFSQAFHVDFEDKNFEEETENQPSVLDLLKSYSEKVKNYTIKNDENLKTEIEDLYQKILPNLGEDDPRKRAIDSLKTLVK